MRYLNSTAVGLALAAATLTVASAHAQAAAPAAAEPALSEVVVTAQRREENLQSVPIAVTAISGESATRAGITNTQDLTTLSPGLMVQSQAASVQMYLRGVGTDNSTAGTENAVATFIDGVYVPSMAGLFFSFNNIARVEVLKGPQGTLYGRNAVAGAINVVTKDPSYDPQAQVSVGYGNLERTEASFYGSTGLSDTVAANLAVLYAGQGKGAGRNLFNGKDVNQNHEFGVTSKLLFTPTDDLEVRLSGFFERTKQSYGLAYRQAPGTVLLDGAPSFPGGFYDVNNDFQPWSAGQTTGLTARIDYDLGWARFASISAYQRLRKKYKYDNDGSAAPLVHVDFGQFDRNFSQELQLSSPAGADKLTWVAGLYYFRDSAGYDPFALTGLGLAPLDYLKRTSKQKTQSYAIYGQGTYEIAPRTNLTVGLRYTKDRRTLRAVDDSNLGILATYAPPRSTSGAVTWRLALDHKLNDDVMVYASYSRGFKSGVFNTAGPTDPAVRPERLDDWEVGFKSQLLDNRVRFNANAFYYKYRDIQFASYLGPTITLLNAARAELYGVDVDVEVAITRDLKLSGAVEALHSKYTSFPNAPFTSSNYPAPGNIAFAGDATGNELDKAPHVSFNTALDYTAPIDVAGGSIAANVTYYYNDGFYWAPDNRVRQSSFNVLNASLSWSTPGDRYKVTLWGKNLTSAKYFTQLSEQAGLGDTAAAAAPRMYGVRLSASF